MGTHSVRLIVTLAVMGLASFCTGLAVTWLGVVIALRRQKGKDGAHWTERAMMAYFARRVAYANAILVPAITGLYVRFLAAPAAGLSSGLATMLCATAAIYGAVLVMQWLERRLCRPGWKGIGIPTFFLSFTLAPVVVIAPFIPIEWGWQAGSVLAAGAAVVTFLACGGWIPLLGLRGWMKPASPRLLGIVELASNRAGVRPPRVLEMASPNANALAVFVPKILVFTDTAPDFLDDDELSVVTAHELAHLDEPATAFLTRMAAAYFTVAFLACIPLLGTYGILPALVPYVLAFGAIRVMQTVGRRMEERSDRRGRDHGEHAGTYARAIEKLYEVNLVPAVMRGKRHIHPHLYDRMVAAGVTPGFERPDPPPLDYLAIIPTFVFLIAIAALVMSSMD